MIGKENRNKINLKQHTSRPRMRILALMLAGVLLAGSAAGRLIVRAALENERSDEVRSVHVSDADIEESTLVIGSHLIYLGALTDELYEIAKESESDFNQYSMYYKSELSGGSWYEITSASSIVDITSSGTPVNKSVIEALEFTHHTKSDGVTYDLRTGNAVSIFDINAPYDLEAMEELEPLRLQYQMLQEKDEDSKTESDLTYIEMIGDFFALSIRNEVTDSHDEALRGLQNYKVTLTANDADAAMTDKVDEVMGKVDAERRVEALTILAEELDLLELHAGGMNTEEEEAEKERLKEIANTASDEANNYKNNRNYDEAIRVLQEAYDETQLPQVKSELDDARVEKALYDADRALEEFEAKVRGWQEERSEKEDQAASLADEIDSLTEEIGRLEEEIASAGTDDDVSGLEQELEDARNRQEEAQNEYEDAQNRVSELERQLRDENVESARQEALNGTVESLQTLYGELKDTRLYNKITELGRSTDLLEEDPEEDLTFTVNADVISAIGECIQNVQTSLNEYEAKRLTEGTTLTSRLEYRYSNELIENARQNNQAACDTSVDNLIDLANIVEGKVVNQERELALLDSGIVPEGYTSYQAALGAGVSEDYQTAMAENSSRTVLTRYLEEQQSETNSLRLEYQTFLDAKTMRMENGAAQEYILSLIDGIGELEDAVNQDASAAYQEQTVSEHLAWLKEEYSSLAAEGTDSSGMSDLEAEKEQLQEAMRDALDKNDLAEAARQEALVAAKQQDIDDLEAQLLATLNSATASESEKASAAAALNEGGSAANLNRIATDMASNIRDGNMDSLQGGMAAIEAMAEVDPESAQSALSQVEDAIEEAMALESENVDTDALNELQDQADALNESISENLAASGSANLSRQEVIALLESLLGGSFESLSDSEQAAALLAVEWYGEYTLDSSIASLAAEYARQMNEAGSRYLYEKYTKETGEYASLRAVGKTLSYRYIFDDPEQTVTLQSKKVYYQFTAGQKEYQASDGASGTLGQAAGIQDTLYITEKDCTQLFACEVEYIDKAELGVVVTQNTKASAEEIYNSLLEGGA